MMESPNLLSLEHFQVNYNKGEATPLQFFIIPPIIMETILTPEEITELNTTGKVILTDDLMIRMKQFCDLVDTKITESYEDSDWYNDPNCVMSRHHY